MVNLDLTTQEAGDLARILEDVLADLRFEIMDTDDADFREGLKEQESFIKNMLARLAEKSRRVPA